MAEKTKLPHPATTTEEFLHAAVVELRALTAAVEELAKAVAPTTSPAVEGETVALVEGEQPKKGRKKVTE